MQNKSKVLFIHVPRTAGSSIWNFIYQTYHQENIANKNRKFVGHDPFYYHERYYTENDLNNFFKFSVVRNPFTRTYSLYHACCKVLQFRGNDLCVNLSFHQFLNYVRSHGNDLFSNITFNNIPFACFDQCFYLLNSHGTFSLDKIYRHENLKELEEDFSFHLKNVNSVETNYTLNDYLTDYTDQNISLVKSLFFRDFCYLEYSMNFEDSIKEVGVTPPL